MSSLPSTFVLGPSDLGISISMPGPISALTKNTMTLYVEAIGQAVNAEDDDSRLDELKVCQIVHYSCRTFTDVSRII